MKNATRPGRFRILLSIGDQITVERLAGVIGDLQAQKATLHPEQKL
jgi:hypothetical protein